jgi:RNase adaptor protein for sRNA GlmZ degradation
MNTEPLRRTQLTARIPSRMLNVQHRHQAHGGDHMHLFEAVDLALGMATKANILHLVAHDDVLVRSIHKSRMARRVQPVENATVIGHTIMTSNVSEYSGGDRNFAELSIDESNMQTHGVISIQTEGGTEAKSDNVGGTEAKSDSVGGKRVSHFHGNKKYNDALHRLPSYCAWRYAFREAF